MGTITRYFRPDSTTGGDGTENRTDGTTRAYATLGEATIDSEQDLTAAGGNILHLICTTAGVDNLQARFIFYTTSYDDYIFVDCQGAARTNGISRDIDGLGYQLNAPADQDAFTIYEPHFRLSGMEIAGNATSTGTVVLYIRSIQSAWLEFDDCLIVNKEDSEKYAVGTLSPGSGIEGVMNNCLVITQGRGMDIEDLGLAVDHCGVISNLVYGVLADDTCTITNTFSIESPVSDFATPSSSPAGSNNASLDGTAQTEFSASVDIVASANEWDTPSTDPATADFHLLDNLLVGAGTGSRSTDINGTTRVAADIGPFAFPVPPLITDVDGDETWDDGDTGLVITGTIFI